MTKFLPVLFLAVPFACTDDPDPGNPPAQGGTGGGAGVAGSGNQGGSSGKAGGNSTGGNATGGKAGSSAGAGRSGSDPGGEGGESATGATGGTAASGGNGGGGQGGTAGTNTSGGEGGAGEDGSAGTGGNGGDVNGLPCDLYFDQLHLLGEIESAINAAAAGDVICLNGRWDGSLAIDNAAATATDRIVLCSSDDGESCTTDAVLWGLHGIGGGISFSPESDGFVVADGNLNCSVDCEDAVGIDLGGAGHIRVLRGYSTSFKHGVQCDTLLSQTAPCDDIELLGLDVSNNDNGIYGSLKNSTLRLVTDLADSHVVYLTSSAPNAPNENIVIEDSEIYMSGSGQPGTSAIKLSGQNRNVVIRGNSFAGETDVVECISDGSNVEEYCDGIEVQGNWIHLFCSDPPGGKVCPIGLTLESTQHARVYNNQFYRTGTQYLVTRDGETPTSDAWFFNNTLICISDCSTAFTLEGSGHRVFNNLFYYEPGAGGADLITGGSTACNTLGTNGENFEHNFVYSTDASPVLPTCGANNSMTLDVQPGFVSYLGANFHIVGASAAAGFGTADGAPAVDYDGFARPNPPSAGAYDVQP